MPPPRAERGVGGHCHCSTAQVLDSGAKLCNSSENVVLLLLYIFRGRNSSGGFHSAFPTNFTSQGTIVETLLVVEHVYFNYAFWNWGNNHRVDQRPTGPNVR